MALQRVYGSAAVRTALSRERRCGAIPGAHMYAGQSPRRATEGKGGRRPPFEFRRGGMARGVSGRRITSGLALSSPPLTCAGSQIATNPDDQGSAAQRSQGEVRPDIEGHGAPPRSHWAPQPKRAPYSVLAQAAVAGSTQRLTRDLLNGGRAASVFEDEALTPEVTGSRLTAAPSLAPTT